MSVVQRLVLVVCRWRRVDLLGLQSGAGDVAERPDCFRLQQPQR
jgi:hypothetical protein